MQLKYIIQRVIPVLLIGSLNSCSKSSTSGGYGTPTPMPVVPTNAINVTTDSHFGSVISNGDGKTFYFFSSDVNGTSACTGACLTAWPVVYMVGPTLGTGLDVADFATITRSDGAKQTTYKGWPLYTYASDSKSGDIKGDGVGGTWFVAKPDYTIMLGKTQLVGNDGVSYDSLYKAGTGNTIYMTDAHGLTLYAFSFDKSGVNNYTKSDFSNDAFWPIVQISTIKSVPSSLDKSAFASITVFGKPQLTYKGWPVYQFGPDTQTRGNTKGISVPKPGVWPVMNQFSPAAP